MEKLIDTGIVPHMEPLRKVYLMPEPADNRKSFKGLGDLVEADTGQKALEDVAYIFLIKGQEHIKILTRDERATSVLELHGEKAREVIRICMEASK